jgi:hypothetical protein
MFYLSAIMYIDDTDLLHWPNSALLDPDNLIAYIQQTTMDYGHLAQASGGILKGEKVLGILYGLNIRLRAGKTETTAKVTLTKSLCD